MRIERFRLQDDTVSDFQTGLVWPRRARLSGTGLTWPEALDFVSEMNRNRSMGFDDWRLPNRRELNSLIDYSVSMPALPPDHPFLDVWSGWYWTSTTSNRAPAYAWWIQFSGGRMFYGKKTEDAMVWPVRGRSETVLATGQEYCRDKNGAETECGGTGQDGELRLGVPWPEPRFKVLETGVLDTATSLVWSRSADLAEGMVDWETGREVIQDLAGKTSLPWRMPQIGELESLVDCSCSDPALKEGHQFVSVPEACWSATSSGLDPEWAFCLYFHKGAVGVGFKPAKEFHVWAVCSASDAM